MVIVRRLWYGMEASEDAGWEGYGTGHMPPYKPRPPPSTALKQKSESQDENNVTTQKPKRHFAVEGQWAFAFDKGIEEMERGFKARERERIGNAGGDNGYAADEKNCLAGVLQQPAATTGAGAEFNRTSLSKAPPYRGAEPEANLYSLAFQSGSSNDLAGGQRDGRSDATDQERGFLRSGGAGEGGLQNPGGPSDGDGGRSNRANKRGRKE
jgi:hypothetical protein